ncbi:hypothetical protein ASPZODRAFT_152880 [Penicilliopsis zonata CBS 506.65]|uniref:L-lactate dehydrogenase (cytochrome) n=1 Tax=Penicilliopsis zonata CBS 506.65 TaxID=1073090 RepID=A0A1L9SFJ6_9EURO|nr:hypothetical protein ASPZODRAFT_152880 [Penicilliopsis zonata CBS 506.65]OJJ45932.1 hypothetical protein ASPZODRAFT_152880 [Penicilliopsis zonata CBS 506.65]
MFTRPLLRLARQRPSLRASLRPLARPFSSTATKPRIWGVLAVATVATVATESPLISYEEVQKHTSLHDCWVIIKGHVYDVTALLQTHPGGQEAILAQAGKDVTNLFTMLHPPTALSTLPPSANLGPVDASTMPTEEERVLTEEEILQEEAREEMPEAADMLLLDDFEAWAERVLSGTAWAYYRSAADGENSFMENRNAFRRYFFRPRVLRDMSTGSTETSFMGVETSMPVFISPAAMAKLGHPLGEVNLTKAAAECGIVQMISCNASCSVEELFEAKQPGQALFFQIYLNKNREESAALIRKVDNLGAKAIVFTVDVARQSKRTRDVRYKAMQNPTRKTDQPVQKAKSVSESISGYQDTNLTWKDITFIREHTKLPIIVKGVQSLEDVQLCVDHGVEGVILSNHGGRQADYAPAPVDILYEIRTHRPDLFDKIDVMIDGGIRTGADVVKALAMGAKAVGLGRPFLYANGTHGQEGVERAAMIMQEEITNTMRNIGASTVDELRPEMVGPAGPWVGWNRPV